MTSFFDTRDTLASSPEDAARLTAAATQSAHARYLLARDERRVHHRGRAQLAADARCLPPAGDRHREHPGEWPRARGQPHVELRPLAARVPALAQAAAP